MQITGQRYLAVMLLFIAGGSHSFVPHLPSHFNLSIGQTVVVQVLSTQVTPDLPFAIESIDARIDYDASALAFVTARAGSALTGGAQAPQIVANDTGTEVVLAVAVIQPQTLQEDGVLLELEFVVQAGISGQTSLQLNELSLNEGALVQSAADVSDEDGVVSTESEPGTGSSIVKLVIAICSQPGASC